MDGVKKSREPVNSKNGKEQRAAFLKTIWQETQNRKRLSSAFNLAEIKETSNKDRFDINGIKCRNEILTSYAREYRKRNSKRSQ